MTDRNPPRELRSAILTAALDARPAGYPDPEALPPQAVPYGLEVRKLDVLLREATAAQWDTTVLGGMTARQLVDHLAGNDRSLAGLLPLDPPKADVQGASPEQSYRTWREQAFALLRHAVFAPLAGRVDFAGLSMPLGHAYLNRAFETWIHADDIRLAIGRQADPPRPAHLRSLADLHIRSLPTALRLSGRDHVGRGARISLTGAMTQEWFISLSSNTPADADRPDVSITADALEFCYLAANRRTPEAVPLTVTGDREVAADLLAAMTFFSDE
ncbi:MAG: maleylpyruvate isomerase family mycothiol-dependent enzyme [Actinophytocola sp.]|uniref:maleylpyruvate isomerase family mycothiol-dependent enzyme n=1 Tax=Actinophytocola sp. TaxID=1872138 RepID=UPI003D6C19D6